MSTIWIEAALALKIASNGAHQTFGAFTLCERAYAGLIRAKAKTFIFGEDTKSDAEIPKGFWWAKGHEALEQNWAAGDFSTWLDQRVEMHAFGVRFALDDVLEILPVEQRALVARQCSVQGSNDWYSARQARDVVANNENLHNFTAGNRLIELAKLGFVTGRAVQMFSGKELGSKYGTFEREWDIPVWFWTEYCAAERSVQYWELGKFSGRAYRLDSTNCIELTGVHFLRATIDASLVESDAHAEVVAKKPNLSGAELNKWWESMASSREQLSQEQLITLVRAKYHENYVARDRIRELSGGRKRGPKVFGG
jgi:hypothetical protein